MRSSQTASQTRRAETKRTAHLEEGCLRGVETGVAQGHHDIIGRDQTHTGRRSYLVLHDLITQLQCTPRSSHIEDPDQACTSRIGQGPRNNFAK